MNRNSRDRQLALAAAALYLALSAAIACIGFYTIRGYEISLYTALPPFFWLLFFTALAGGILLVVYSALIERGRPYWWRPGLVLVLMANLVVALLPFLRGYAISASEDHMTHLGYINNILLFGTVETNPYPITHTLCSQIGFLSQIAPERYIAFIGPLFYLLFIVTTYLLAREVLEKRAAILAVLTSTVLNVYYFGQLFPMGFTLLTIPLILYLYVRFSRSGSLGFGIPLVLLVAAAPMFHPVSASLLVIVLLVMEASGLIHRRWQQKVRVLPSIRELRQIRFSLSYLIIIILVVWAWRVPRVWNGLLDTLEGWYTLTALGEGPIEEATGAAWKLGLSIFDILLTTIKGYGVYFLLLGLSLAAILMVLWHRNTAGVRDTRAFVGYSCLFLLATLLWIVDFVHPLTGLASERMKFFVITLFPLLVGLSLHSLNGLHQGLFGRLPLRRIRPLLIVGVILFASVLSIWIFYPSPFIYRTNDAISHASLEGEFWVMEHRKPNTTFMYHKVPPPYRIASAHLGMRQDAILRSQVFDLGHVSHFNYTSHRYLGESIAGDRYIMLDEKFILEIYSTLYRSLARFNESDFERLDSDPTVDRIYEGQNMEVYLVHGSGARKKRDPFAGFARNTGARSEGG